MIPTFDKWIIESFNADVDDSDKKSNILDIELPGSNQRKKFKLKGGDAVEITEENPEGEEIDDKKLNKYVTDAIRSIRDIKEQDRATEIKRLSGGDSNVQKTIENMYDNNDETPLIRKNKPGNNKETPDDYSLYNLISDLKNSGDSKFISLDNISTEQQKLFGLNGHGIGKGEYFLPFLYPDVYKRKSHGYEDDDTFAKGDNYIKVSDGENEQIFDLELKTAGAAFGFEKIRKKQINRNDVFNKETYDTFLDAVTGGLVKYLYRRNLKNDLYLIIFNNECNVGSQLKTDSTKCSGFLVIYIGKTVSGITKEEVIIKRDEYKKLFDSIKKLIKISDTPYPSSSDNYDFIISYDSKDEKIVCYVSKKYFENAKIETYETKYNIKYPKVKELLKQGYSVRDVVDMSGAAHAIVSDIKKELENKENIDFSKIEKIPRQSETKKQIKEKKEKIDEIVNSKRIKKIDKLIKPLKEKLEKNKIDILSEEERDKIISKIKNDTETFNRSLIGKKLKKYELKELKNSFKTELVTYMIINGYTNDEIHEFIEDVSTNLINKIKNIILKNDNIEIKEHPSIQKTKYELSQLEKEKKELEKQIDELKEEINILTLKRIDNIRELAKEGKNANQIAKEMGESGEQIRNWCKKYNIELKKDSAGRGRKSQKTNESLNHYILTFNEMFK